MASKIPWLLIAAGVGGLLVGMAGKKDEPDTREPDEPEPEGYEVIEEGVIEIEPEPPEPDVTLPTVEFPYRIGRVVAPDAPYNGELMVDGEWVSGPTGPDLDAVREDLRTMAEGYVAEPGVEVEPEYVNDSVYEGYRYRIYVATRTMGQPIYEGAIWVNGEWQPRFDTRAGEAIGSDARLEATRQKTFAVIEQFTADPQQYDPSGGPPVPGFVSKKAPNGDDNGGQGGGLGS